MVRSLPVLVLLFVLTSLASAESWGPYITWKGWKLGSNEALEQAPPYHSLRALVDGDPGTAWVYHKLTAQQRVEGERPQTPQIWICPEHPVQADELWLRNGFDKSDALFRRNNRVTEVKVGPFAQGRAVKLSDRRGWHKISLRQGLQRGLIIELTRQVKGRDDDLCISELALYNKGRRINFNVPPHVLFNNGGGCACGSPDFDLLSGLGYRRATLSGDEGAEPCWHPSGRWVALLAQPRTRLQLAVADLRSGRIICLKDLPERPGNTYYRELRWLDSRRVRYYVDDYVGEGKAAHMVRRGYRTVAVR